MKIRTDFVTNSSSSNYCVEVGVVSRDGDVVSLTVDPAEQYICGDGNATVIICYDEITTAKSIEELYSILIGSIWLEDLEMDKDILEEYFDSYSIRFPDGYSIPSIAKFIENVKNTEDIDIEELEEDDSYSDAIFPDFVRYFEEVQKSSDEFLDKLKGKFPNIEAVAKVIVTEGNNSYGEFSRVIDSLHLPWRQDQWNAKQDEIRKYLEETLTPDSDIDKIMSCIEEGCEAGGYCENITEIDMKTGKIEKLRRVTRVQ